MGDLIRYGALPDGVTLRFKIGAFTPSTIPMEKLAEYMRDLAVILGSPENVHFLRLEAGSTEIVHVVDRGAFLVNVMSRVGGVRYGAAPVEAIAAYRSINKRLAEDRATGALINGELSAEILNFPGMWAVEAEPFPPVTQAGAIDGVVIRLGGTGANVPVHVQAGDTVYSKCLASREIARELGHHLFGGPLRLTGQGKWTRDADGVWNLDRFLIGGFEPLDSKPLSRVVSELRSLRSGWEDVADPWDEIMKLRNDDEGEDAH
ncbi:hypothetical protein MCBMB27_05730 (plasmid) [Methylobacterium phyllosphaerae]|uniref:Uncharacterized protein n=1 Tax=Methylobacterium phyllosphaerae TaxID=418223 RepID=A0AAE8HXU0_9HYPH|nr:hypothetical protein [Methylobacterium phyllosphaerae]APT35021.1 hypothetical protein MCBMB27_05730 [Methylobacterium phyllosphaerae]SFH67256.1 hypothetical protein SAMN05192567_14216 [Methylobacterium phyllosphaerae]